MVSFSEEVISEIKRAATEFELEEIIANSFLRLKLRHFRNENTYSMNMIVSLQAMRNESFAPEVFKNIDTAIQMFRQYRKQNPEPLF